MAGNTKVPDKKTLVAIIIIAVLVIAAIVGTVAFLKNRGTAEATDLASYNEQTTGTTQEEQTTTDTHEQSGEPATQSAEEQATEGTEAATTESTETANADTTTAGANQGIAGTGTTGGATGTTGGTTTTTDNIQETTISREETVVYPDQLVAEGEDKIWTPRELQASFASAYTNIEGVQTPDITVNKTATTKSGNNLVQAGEEIRYTIEVTNNTNEKIERIYVTDTIPTNTTYVSSTPNAEEFKNETAVTSLRWMVDIEANSTTSVNFTVTVDENATGKIRNVAIANGEESNPTETAIITTSKTAKITRAGENVQAPAKLDDEITYTITITNTGDVAGSTVVKDTNIEDMLNNGAVEFVSGVKVYEDDETRNVELKDLVSGINVNVNKEAKIEFTVKVKRTDITLENVATIGEEPTNPVEVESTDFSIRKEATLIENTENKDGKAQAGDEIEYVVYVKNEGTAKIEGLTVRDEKLNITLTGINLESLEEKEVIRTRYLVTDKDVENIEKNPQIINTAIASYDGEEKDSTTNTPVEEVKGLSVEKTATKVNNEAITADTKVNTGDKITYTITVTNTGNRTIENVRVEESLEVTGDLNIGTLTPGASKTITVEYTVKLDDIKDKTELVNVVTATNDDVTSDPDDEKTPVEEEKGLSVEKTATMVNGEAVTADTKVNTGDKITYTITVTNTGNKTLENVRVEESLEVAGDLNIGTLAAGESKTITVEYTVKLDDIKDKAELVNVVTATNDDVTSDPDDEKTPVEEEKGLSVEKTATMVNGEAVTADTKVNTGDKITYTITVTNTGNKTLENVRVEESLEVAGDLNIGTLAAGESKTITVEYTVKLDDIKDKAELVNVVTATNDDVTSNPDDEKTPVEEEKGLSVKKTATMVNGAPITAQTEVVVGDEITYTITVTNTGNKTLENVRVEESLEVTGDLNIGTLAPGATTTITVKYEVTTDDVKDKTELVNVVTATNDDVTSDPDDEKTPIKDNPDVTIDKSATHIKAVGTDEFVKVVKDGDNHVKTFIANVGDVIKYEITATNTGNITLNNVQIKDNNFDVKVVKIIKYNADNEMIGEVTPEGEATIQAGNDLLQLLSQDITKTLEPQESFKIIVEYEVKNVNNVENIENTAKVEATPKDEEQPINEEDNEQVPVQPRKVATIDKTSVKVNGTEIQNAEDVKLKKNDKITYEITVANAGNRDLTGVTVTDDHDVRFVKVEKVNADGTRTPTNLKGNKDNLLGKDTLAVGETYVITVTYTVPDDVILEGENGDKVINTAYIDTNETEKRDDNDILEKYKAANIVQSKTSKDIGNTKGDHIITTGDRIEYTITVENTGNISGETVVKDSQLKANIDAEKVVMVDENGNALSKNDSYDAKCINVSSTLGSSSKISVGDLAGGYPLSEVKSGEVVTITFTVEVGKLLPGDTVENALDGEDNTYTENDVEASITVNKKLVKPQNTVIVIDLSLSMAEAVDYDGNSDPMASSYGTTRWYALKQALDTFLNTYMGGKDNQNTVTIIGYNETAQILVDNTTSISAAKNSYANVLTSTQFNSVPWNERDDVDNLKVYNTGTKLASGTNIEDGLIHAQNILKGKEKGAQVILMTDGEANRSIEHGQVINDSNGINEAAKRADELKDDKAILYTVSLSIGRDNQTYIQKLQNMASKDENGAPLSTSANNIGDLTEYFEEISEILSEFNETITTQNGYLVLKDTGFDVDSRYVQNVIITIPNEDTNTRFELSWNEFTNYYDAVGKTINIREFARAQGIKGITGDITIEINVDPTIG